MTPDYRVISIGTLAAHPLWDEKAALRTGHATTTLVSAGDVHILVNPGLPAQSFVARMAERTRVTPQQITHVFLTSLELDHFRALAAFDHATWLAHETEINAARAVFKELRTQALGAGNQKVAQIAQQELAMVDRCEAAPDSIAPKVDIFPLPGVTVGTCGLLIALPGSTVLICGDAIPTVEHLSQGKVLQRCVNLAQAQESFKEAVEIADVLILGRDNIALNPLRRL